jgi:hypothetical protein
MSHAICISLLAIVSLFAPARLPALGQDPSAPCGTIAGVLVTDFVFRTPVLQLPRVEIRQCGPETAGSIQIVAWTSGKSAAPALVVDTGDFGVVQTVARANVFVVETGGATRDRVFIIVYEGGQPKVAMQRTTRGTASVRVDRTSLDVEIAGIYAGDAPPRLEKRRFKLDLDALRPR